MYAESKINLVILYVDLVGSTRLSMMLPIDRLTVIIRAFTQEMFLMVSTYGGYVLKYIGDAVLAFFVVQEQDLENYADDSNSPRVDSSDNNMSYLQCNNAINCAGSMIKIIREGINPILDQYGYPELSIRVGIDFGQDAVVQY
jgi:class 3 adenylate cyclase